MTIATIFAYHRHRSDRRFIVVCPSSLVSNWSKEFDKWLGKASQPKRVLVRNGLESEGLRSLKSFVPLKPNLSEVLILSYELFRMHVKVINKAGKIGMLVVDEGHRLKNTSGSKILTALNSIEVESRILITGTPIQVCLFYRSPLSLCYCHEARFSRLISMRCIHHYHFRTIFPSSTTWPTSPYPTSSATSPPSDVFTIAQCPPPTKRMHPLPKSKKVDNNPRLWMPSHPHLY